MTGRDSELARAWELYRRALAGLVDASFGPGNAPPPKQSLLNLASGLKGPEPFPASPRPQAPQNADTDYELNLFPLKPQD